MAKIPLQWRVQFVEWVSSDNHYTIYQRDQDECVKQFLPKDFHLVRLPVGA